MSTEGPLSFLHADAHWCMHHPMNSPHDSTAGFTAKQAFAHLRPLRFPLNSSSQESQTPLPQRHMAPRTTTQPQIHARSSLRLPVISPIHSSSTRRPHPLFSTDPLQLNPSKHLDQNSAHACCTSPSPRPFPYSPLPHPPCVIRTMLPRSNSFALD